MSRALPRFAQCWQDPEVVLAARQRLGLRGGIRVEGGTGDLALDFASEGIGVEAAPDDEAARALTELKIAAVRHLPLQSVVSFLGLGHFGRRVWFYHHLRDRLSPSTIAWTDPREHLVREGILDSGQFERTTGRLRALLGLSQPEGATWAVFLTILGTPMVRSRSGFAAGGGRGGPAVWGTTRAIDDSPWSSWLASGGWADPGAAHRWLNPEGHAAARDVLPTIVAPSDPITSELVVLPDFAEFASDAVWSSFWARIPPATWVLAWERYRVREGQRADVVDVGTIPDRSPLHARFRVWRVRD